MNLYHIYCKQIVDEPSDADDAQDLNLGKGYGLTWDIWADSESEALDKYHSSVPIGNLEDYEITVEKKKEKVDTQAIHQALLEIERWSGDYYQQGDEVDLALIKIRKEIGIQRDTENQLTGSTHMKEAVELTTAIMQSYPEYNSEWIRCRKYDYGMDEAMENQIKPASYTFKVSDPETDCEKFNTKTMSPEDVATIVPTFKKMVDEKKIHLCGLTSDNFWDPCSWDSEATDCLMQLFFYKEIVYG